ncbi:MAG: hypothetical protein K8R56_02625 [Candidatus Eisenbacteria bacterium]|nr:hypothetical protein [Candidatus Eisenbacteria bacterium]
MMRRLALLAALALCTFASLAVAAGIPAPPHLEMMWNGKDGATVRAFLQRTVAAGDAPGASASQKLDSGDAAYWLGVQDARAGRADSALAHWRHAWRLRGDFDEGFAIIDALTRSGGNAKHLAEARAIAGELAQQADLSAPNRVPDAHARLGWTLSLLGRADSAVAALQGSTERIERRPLWTRRFMLAQSAGGDDAGAWRNALLTLVRRRGNDRVADSVLVRAQHRLHYTDDRRTLAVSGGIERTKAEELAFAATFGGALETLRAKDGFALQLYTFPAKPDSGRRAALLFVLSPADTVCAVDSLVAACTANGHPVALLAPRGAFGSLGAGSMGPEDWIGRERAHFEITTSDAALAMDALSKRPAFKSPGWIVGTVGDRAPVALALAKARRDIKALLLVAPRVPVVEVAEYRAQLRAAGTRTFVQVSPEEPDALEFGDLLSRATAPGQVRVADSGLHGRGGAIFRGEGKITRRLFAWLAE